MYQSIFSFLVLTSGYLRMDEDVTWPATCTLSEHEIEYKINTNNKNTEVSSKSGRQSLRTHSLTSDFQRVSLQNKRKQILPDSSSKIVKKEQSQRSVNFVKQKRRKTIEDTGGRQPETGNTSRCRNLLPQLLKKDKDGDTILHLSIVQNDIEKSKSLIEIMSGKSLDVANKLQQTPLHLSVLTCQAIIVEFLIFHGACVNKRDRNGQTALHLASKNADIECVKAIKHATESPRYSADYADEKPDLNLKNFEGQAAFHLAALSGSEEIAKTLLDMKADIDIQDGTSGRTALHLTVESHNINMINFLLKNGANVNAATFSGNTALHLASGFGMSQLVQLLLRNGANINITNIEGDTPLYTKIVTDVQWKPPRKHQMKTMQRKSKSAFTRDTTFTLG